MDVILGKNFSKTSLFIINEASSRPKHETIRT